MYQIHSVFELSAAEDFAIKFGHKISNTGIVFNSRWVSHPFQNASVTPFNYLFISYKSRLISYHTFAHFISSIQQKTFLTDQPAC